VGTTCARNPGCCKRGVFASCLRWFFLRVSQKTRWSRIVDIWPVRVRGLALIIRNARFIHEYIYTYYWRISDTYAAVEQLQSRSFKLLTICIFENRPTLNWRSWLSRRLPQRLGTLAVRTLFMRSVFKCILCVYIVVRPKCIYNKRYIITRFRLLLACVSYPSDRHSCVILSKQHTQNCLSCIFLYIHERIYVNW